MAPKKAEEKKGGLTKNPLPKKAKNLAVIE